MMITIALLAVFTAALCASVLSLADTLVRGRKAYMGLKGALAEAQQPKPYRVIRPAAFEQSQQAGPPASLKFAA